MRNRIHRASYHQAGRITPDWARGLRARVVVLRERQTVDWHSTATREELLIALSGRVRVEIGGGVNARARSMVLAVGQCLFLPEQTRHRVVNRSAATASYLYVTAPVLSYK